MKEWQTDLITDRCLQEYPNIDSVPIKNCWDCKAHNVPGGCDHQVPSREERLQLVAVVKEWNGAEGGLVP